MGSNRTAKRLLVLAAPAMLSAVAAARLDQTSRTSRPVHSRHVDLPQSFVTCLSDQFFQRQIHTDLVTQNSAPAGELRANFKFQYWLCNRESCRCHYSLRGCAR
jgi:hypothetical protein